MSAKKSICTINRVSDNSRGHRLNQRLEKYLSADWDYSNVSDSSGASGPDWWQCRKFIKNIEANIKNSDYDITLSLERGVCGDLYCATDGAYDKWLEYKFQNSHFHMLSPWHSMAPRLEQKSIEGSRIIVACSEMVMSELEILYPKMRDKIRVIYYGYDPEQYHVSKTDKQTLRDELNLPKEGWMVLFKSDDWEHDGFEETLRFTALASSIVKDPTMQPFIAAVGKNSANFSSMIKKLGLKDRIYAINSNTDDPKLYQAADVLLMPTAYDPFSTCCLEALACGCPVVTTENNGAAEIIKHMETGFIIEAGENDIRREAVSWSLLRQLSKPDAIAETVKQFSETEEANRYTQALSEITGAE